jgi:hypothetical protein
VCPCVIQVYQAAKDIGASHDALAPLLELVEQFVNRLEIYTKVTHERAMVELIVKMMVQLLHVLGLVTKEIRRKPLSKSVLCRYDTQLNVVQLRSERSFWERMTLKWHCRSWINSP